MPPTTHRGVGESTALGRGDDLDDGQRGDGTDEGELGSHRETARECDQQILGRGPRLTGVLDEERRRHQDQGQTHGVRVAPTRLCRDETRCGEQQCRAHKGERGDPERLADAPCGHQSQCEPAEVDQGGDEIGSEQENAEAVQQRRGRGVEGGDRVAVHIVDGHGVAGLHEARRDRQVVPEGVDGFHPSTDRPRCPARPTSDQDRHDDSGRNRLRSGDSGERFVSVRLGGRAVPGEDGRREPHEGEADHDRRGVEAADGSQQLARDDGDAKADDDIAQPSRGTTPRGQDPLPDAVGAPRDGRQRDRGQHDAEGEPSEGHGDVLPAIRPRVWSVIISAQTTVRHTSGISASSMGNWVQLSL